MSNNLPLNNTQEWALLKGHKKDMEQIHMRDLFTRDPERFEHFNLQCEGLLFDYSKNRITEDTIESLMALVDMAGLTEKRTAMFSGSKINKSEDRAVLHTALRRPPTAQVLVDDENIIPVVHKTLDKMAKLSHDIRNGNITGHTGKPFENIVHIGIGGSGLGPEFAYEALRHTNAPEIPCRFVSNIDGAQIHDVLQGCDPETTLFVVVSKSFTTEETLENARTARDWLAEKTGCSSRDGAKHFIAVTAASENAANFGIARDHILPLPDWVGGRYSLWSAAGISLCIAFGFDSFRALLDGAHRMDRHFTDTPLRQNIPVIMALIGIWHRNFWDYQVQAILPYSHALRLLPFHLQQLDMESNGKHCLLNMEKAPYHTGSVLFGSAGTDCQHSYFQLLHQGTTIVPCDFIGVASAAAPYKNAHRKLLSHMLAQSKALMEGSPGINSSGQLSHNHFDGNRPSNTIILQRADAFHIGLLLALYEHKVFVQGVIWNINSFDQWGVELGKTLAKDIQSAGGSSYETDSSTAGLMAHLGL